MKYGIWILNIEKIFRYTVKAVVKCLVTIYSISSKCCLLELIIIDSILTIEKYNSLS